MTVIRRPPKFVPYGLWCLWREWTICRWSGHTHAYDDIMGDFCPVCGRQF